MINDISIKLFKHHSAFIVHVILITFIINTGIIYAEETPESTAGMLGLLVSPSVRINGLGQAGVAIIDEPGAYYNPAALAFATKSHYFYTTNYRGIMKWLPELTDDMRYSYDAFQIGYNKLLNEPISSNNKQITYIPFSISGSIGYSKTKFDLRHIQKLAITGTEIIGEIKPYEVTENLTISTGLHYLGDIGLGITFKKLKYYETVSYAVPEKTTGIYSSTASEIAYDFGMLANFPIIDTIEYLRGKEIIISGCVKPAIDISAGFSQNNQGEDIKYKMKYGSHFKSLPQNTKIGCAFRTGLSYFGEIPIDLIYFTGSSQLYIPQIKRIKQDWSDADVMGGIEFSFLEMIDIRNGRYHDGDGNIHLKTDGYTIKSNGILKIVLMLLKRTDNLKSNSASKTLAFLSNRLSISWSKFNYKSIQGWNPLNNISHYQVTVSF